MRLLLNHLVKKSPWFYQIQFPYCKKFWDGFDNGLVVVNLGSNSGLKAFKYDNKIKAANWATSPQPLVLSTAIYNTYKRYLKKGAYVLIPLCPFSSMVGYNCYVNNYYYSILPDQQIPQFKKQLRKYNRTLLEYPYKFYPLYNLLSDTKGWIMSLIKKFRNTETDRSEQWYKDNASNWIKSWISEFDIMSLDAPLTQSNSISWAESSEILYNLLKNIINEGYNPVILYPPVSRALSDCFSDKMRSIYMRNYLTNSVRNLNVRILDYLDNEKFSSSEYFQDAYLLNSKGAELFTSIVLRDLNIL